MRALIFELRPGALAEEGLAAALRKQAAALSSRTGLRVAVEGQEERLDVTPATEEHLYRLALEALNNTVKHAHARTATITLTVADERIELAVNDDGVGFATSREHPGHLGLRPMQERASAVGGTLEVHSQTGRGTTVRLLAARDSTSGSEEAQLDRDQMRAVAQVQRWHDFKAHLGAYLLINAVLIIIWARPAAVRSGPVYRWRPGGWGCLPSTFLYSFSPITCQRVRRELRRRPRQMT